LFVVVNKSSNDVPLVLRSLQRDWFNYRLLNFTAFVQNQQAWYSFCGDAFFKHSF